MLSLLLLPAASKHRKHGGKQSLNRRVAKDYFFWRQREFLGRFGSHSVCLMRKLAHCFCRFFKSLVFAKLPYENLAGILLGFVAVSFFQHGREKRPRLCVNKRCGNSQELTRLLHVKLIKLRHITQELGSDFRNKNVLYIDFRFFNKMDKQIKRPVKLLQMYPVLHISALKNHPDSVTKAQ